LIGPKKKNPSGGDARAKGLTHKEESPVGTLTIRSVDTCQCKAKKYFSEHNSPPATQENWNYFTESFRAFAPVNLGAFFAGILIFFLV
jgi:hypothetical protein